MKKSKIRIWIIDKNTILITLYVIIFITVAVSNTSFSSHSIPESENNLKGKTIVIDAGHGGIDGGTNKDNILEKNINLNIAGEVALILKTNKANVILTRDSDVSLDNLYKSQDSRYKRDLNARLNIINSSKADLFISIHANCLFSDISESGTMIFYQGTGSPSNSLAENLMFFINKLDYVNIKRKLHSPQIGNYYILKNAKIPGVIVETGFISNKDDAYLLTSDDFKHKISKAICVGINEYFKKP